MTHNTIRLNEELVTNDSNYFTGSYSLFDCLPLELYLKIFSHLSVKSLLNIRACNKHFKFLIDQIESIWRRSYLKLDLDTKSVDLITKLEFTRHLLDQMTSIDQIEIRCAHLLTSQERETMETMRRGGIFKSDEYHRVYSFRLALLNTRSMVDCFSYIASNCNELIIESFYEPTGQSATIKNSNLECLRFERLTSLDLNCVISKRIDAPNYFQQHNDQIKTTLVDRFDQLFPFLARLHLRLFIYSPLLLYRKLVPLTQLRFIEFHNCWTNGSSNDIRVELDRLERSLVLVEPSQRLAITECLFRSTKFSAIFMFLEYFINLECLHTLNLFSLSLGAHEFETLLYLMVNRMPNLHSLSTDLFQTDVLNDFFEPRHYSLAEAVFSRLDQLVMCDCCSFYDDFYTNKKSKRGRHLANYNFRFCLEDFERLFGGLSRNRGRKLKSISVTFVDDCELCHEKKIQQIMEAVIGCFDMNVDHGLTSLEVKFKCESFVFNRCDSQTCRFRLIRSHVGKSSFFQKFKIIRNSIRLEI